MNDNFIMLAEKAMASNFNHTEHIYIDICGDLIAGTLLSQILYWFKPSSNGKMKVRVFHEGEYWLAKTREEWWDEIRITPRQFDYAMKSLLKKEFVEKKIFKFNGIPTVHIRPIAKNINRATDEWVRNYAISIEKEAINNENTSISTKCKNGFLQNVKMDFDKSVKSITENTTYNTDSIIKYGDSNGYQDSNNLSSISIEESMVSPQTTQKGWFEYLDISNNAMLLSELDKIQYFQKGDPKYDYLYTIFSTFADEFIKHRGYKHKEISCIDLNKMSTKLSSFVQKEYIPETDEYVVKNPRKFSIYEYEKNDLVWMVKDYFEYQFDDCDYSLWHFMSDNVLSARFWRMENRRTESVI